MNSARVATTTGLEFGPDYGEFVRLNFATPTDILDESLSRIATAIHQRLNAAIG
jgi:bifunctional pyridoxal-dependent enzyme with beta-cystathionase and maltose regulon repressor activities